MKLLVSQKNKLFDLIQASGADIGRFEFIGNSKFECAIIVKEKKDLLFNFRDSIQGAEFCDIFYRPTKKQASKHIYLSVNTFEEIIPYFQEWLDCLSLEVGVEDKWNK